MATDGRPPSFQFYPRDLLTSRTVLAMIPAARGAYLFLLCHAWLSDVPGTLPDDRSILAALAGMTADEWREVEDQVLTGFVHTDGGYVQTRLRMERGAQRKRFQQAVHGGWLRANAERDSAGRFVSTSRSTPSPPLASASASASALTRSTSVSEPSTSSDGENGHPPPVGGLGPVSIETGKSKSGLPDETWPGWVETARRKS